MNYSEADRLNIWLSIAFEGAARSAKLASELNNGPAEFREAVLKGTAVLPNIGEAHKKKVFESAHDAYLDGFIANLEKAGIAAITLDSPNYPVLLDKIDDPPFVLYAIGKAASRQIVNPIAVIGTRRCSDYGRTVAGMMGRALAENGCTVISGLAPGCDSYAHEGALMAEGNDFPTVAVLGQGVLVRKTDYTAKVMEAILERGMVVSEFLPNTPAQRGSFPMRNRIISGISNGVVVVEAGQKSGTMITVDCALDQGRNVYAVPCRITEVLNFGTNTMLSQGMAQPVYSTDDLLLQLGIEPKHTKSAPSVSEMILDVKQKSLYETIALGEKSFDDLYESTGLTVEELNMHLTDLEFSGLIKQLPGRVYTVS